MGFKSLLPSYRFPSSMRTSVRMVQDEATVKQAVGDSHCLSEALRRLGLRPAGGNHATLKRLIERWDISTDHFDPYQHARGPRPDRVPLEEVLVESSTYGRKHLKRRLFESRLKQSRCELCGQPGVWRGKPMTLILDHVNGVPDDNRLENLRIACPNCAATFDTHCGRKNQAVPRERKCVRCQQVFTPTQSTQRYCSSACGSRHSRTRGPQPDRRKVSRPDHPTLASDIAELGYRGAGRKYGVSDNAVRKWLRAYE